MKVKCKHDYAQVCTDAMRGIVEIDQIWIRFIVICNAAHAGLLEGSFLGSKGPAKGAQEGHHISLQVVMMTLTQRPTFMLAFLRVPGHL